jgi:hypothetical protein
MVLLLTWVCWCMLVPLLPAATLPTTASSVPASVTSVRVMMYQMGISKLIMGKITGMYRL